MRMLFVSWAIAAAVLTLVAIWLGIALKRGYLGCLIDHRGRYSLTQLQLILWSIVVISLIVGLYVARAFADIPNALDFDIPDELLAVLGISAGSTAVATTVKAGKDASHPESIAASDATDRPRFAQIFLLEEGELADRVVDVTKFQNFWFTIVLVVAYVFLAIETISAAESVEAVTLPGFAGTFLTLLGISHAAYLAGKLPTRTGDPGGLTVARRRAHAVPVAPAAVAAPAAGAAQTYAPRNPPP